MRQDPLPSSRGNRDGAFAAGATVRRAGSKSRRFSSTHDVTIPLYARHASVMTGPYAVATRPKRTVVVERSRRRAGGSALDRGLVVVGDARLFSRSVGVISGRMADAGHYPLPGARVKSQPTGLANATDREGNLTLVTGCPARAIRWRALYCPVEFLRAWMAAETCPRTPHEHEAHDGEREEPICTLGHGGRPAALP